MRIALISFSNNYDMQKYIYSMYDVLKENYEVSTYGSNKLMFNLSLKTDRNYLFKVPNRPGVEIRSFFILEIFKIIKKLKQNNVDNILFVSSHVWNIVLIKILKGTDVTITHIIHDFKPHEKEKSERNVNRYNNYIIKNVDKVILHSKKGYDYFRTKHKDVRCYHIQLWDKYLDFTKNNNTNRVLFFGRITPYKGIMNVLELARKNKNFNFDIIGRLSEEMNYLDSVIKKFDNINFINEYVSEEEMHKYFFNSDLIILPYTSATQSGVVVEAYKHSRPVIAFNVGGLEDQIIDKETGYLINSGNINLFNETLNQYLNKDGLDKDRICYKAWEYGKKKFSAENVSESLIKVLNDN